MDVDRYREMLRGERICVCVCIHGQPETTIFSLIQTIFIAPGGVRGTWRLTVAFLYFYLAFVSAVN